jgi:hypothetical protein
MAPNSAKKASWERQDEQRLREALVEIARSPNLRYFVRNLLGSSGVMDIMPSDNALSMARAAGRHELGMTLIATMNQYLPDLWPNLLLEEHNELAERNSAPATYERPDRGEPESIANERPSDNDY